MVKNPSQEGSEKMTHFDSWKKFKRFRLFEPSLGILGFLFVTVCILCCFFYLNGKTVIQVKKFSIETEGQGFFGSRVNNNSDTSRELSKNGVGKFMSLKFGGGEVAKHGKFEFLSEEGGGCDVFDGDWVWDETYPLYESRDCRLMDEGFRCAENGRPDLIYTKWRWQPKHCNLPRFRAKKMLKKLRNKRLVFVGDSIGRNQWESLLCMLSSAVSNKDSIYEVNGNPITKHKGFLVFKFVDYNCTVEYYRAPFLVLQSRPPANSAGVVRTTLKLDQLDWSFMKWRDADILVFNTGHWWNYEKTIRGGCYFQEGHEVKMKMTVDTAYRKAVKTVLDWIQRETNPSKTQVFFRTYAPVHFRGGDWKVGGSCHLETLPDLRPSVPSVTSSKYSIFHDVLSTYSNTSGLNSLDVLDVTNMTLRRKDGHSSLYYLGPKLSPSALNRQDCSHWCLPGVPDTWNELLYALFLKREMTRGNTSLTHHQMKEVKRAKNAKSFATMAGKKSKQASFLDVLGVFAKKL